MYISVGFRKYCRNNGVRIDYAWRQREVAKRFITVAIEKARTILNESGLSKSFWPKAVYCATYLANRHPTGAFVDERANCTPAELWYGGKPNIFNLKVFGSVYAMLWCLRNLLRRRILWLVMPQMDINYGVRKRRKL